jgi:hypothetical protein
MGGMCWLDELVQLLNQHSAACSPGGEVYVNTPPTIWVNYEYFQYKARTFLLRYTVGSTVQNKIQRAEQNTQQTKAALLIHTFVN